VTATNQFHMVPKSRTSVHLRDGWLFTVKLKMVVWFIVTQISLQLISLRSNVSGFCLKFATTTALPTHHSFHFPNSLGRLDIRLTHTRAYARTHTHTNIHTYIHTGAHMRT